MPHTVLWHSNSSGLHQLYKMIILVVLFFTTFTNLGSLAAPTIESGKLAKRSAAEDSGLLEFSEYQPAIQYDEYPVVVPKRAALLLDRMMVAIQKAMEEEAETEETRAMMKHKQINSFRNPGKSFNTDSIDESNDIHAMMSPNTIIPTAEDTMGGLQRRGHGGSVGGQQHKGRVYWRCYFNAVTCFKRK